MDDVIPTSATSKKKKASGRRGRPRKDELTESAKLEQGAVVETEAPKPEPKAKPEKPEPGANPVHEAKKKEAEAYHAKKAKSAEPFELWHEEGPGGKVLEKKRLVKGGPVYSTYLGTKKECRNLKLRSRAG